MKMGRPVIPILILSFFVVSLIILSVPPPTLAQNPQACPNWTAHLGNNLGNQTNYTFQFYRDCPGYWSYAIKWQFIIQDAVAAGQPTICTSGPSQVDVPADGKATLPCNGLPRGTAARIKITINYTVPPNNPMVHTHTISNY